LRPKTALLHFSFFLLTWLPSAAAPPVGPTFNKDILPIIETRCQTCHRPGEIGPMPLITYEQTKPWANAIQEAVKTRKMPPWFSDKCCGQFSTDHILKPEEIALIDAWVTGGAVEGKKKDARPLLRWTNNWTIDGPSIVVSLPRAFEVPANATLDYQYVILPVDLAEDRWASAVEIHPSDRSIVHHAVVYVRPKNSNWLRNVPPLTMYAPKPDDIPPGDIFGDAQSDILAVYTPANRAAIWPAGMGKKLPAGSDLVLQIHYTSKKTAASDRTSVGINFLKEPPKQRVLTLQMQNTDFVIPPGSSDYHASVSGVMPRDATLISFFPYMHVRGSAFDYALVHPGGKEEILLRVKPYDSFWQQSYPVTPRLLPRGTQLRWTGYFDNSAANPRNPDPAAEVRWGEQSRQEMMVGFFDVAVDPASDFTPPIR
jgi:hypothetical protein